MREYGSQLGSWWTDDPLDDLSTDKFGRQAFVERAHRILEQVAANASSTVMGLVGPWGSGKTSTLNMIVSGLDHDVWGVSVVNPWALPDSDSVVAEILAAVGSALPKTGQKAERIRKALIRYGTLATPILSVVPIVGGALAGTGTEAIGRLADRGTLHDQTRAVAAELSELGRPVLVVVDDIDRLQPDELLALFRAVRVLGRLPHVHYMLAYDEQTVLDVLRTTPTSAGLYDRALAYLQKVVTQRLDQPPIQSVHAESMFTAGLTSTLAEAGATITEDQQRRLGDEYEALLAGVLTEPRAVGRFLTQLRVYLPLVGPTEIDLVDFIVLTFLRVTYPQLYRRLSADRRALSGAPDRTNESQLTAWRDHGQLAELGVPKQDIERVGDALDRLFPLIRSPNARSYDPRALRRDRRAADPDHVERYFALTPPTDDLPDEILTRALQEWIDALPGAAVDQVTAILRPDPNDEAACELAARVLRRAAAQSETLSPAACAALLPIAVNLLPEETILGVIRGLDEAAIAWVGVLARRADDSSPEDLLELVARPATATSPLGAFLRGLRQSIHEPFDTTVREVRLAGGGRLWFSRLIEAATGATWQRFLEHIKLGDDAPAEATGWLLRWLDASLGPDETSRRLVGAIDDGLPIEHLAARMVEVGTNLATSRLTVIGFDTAQFQRRLGLNRVRARRASLEAAADPQLVSIDEDDATWVGRRRTAARMLIEAIDQAERDPGVLLPSGPHVQPHPFVNHRPAILDGPSGEDPDLRMQVAILLPRGTMLPTYAETVGGAVGKSWESAIMDFVSRSPVASWLGDIATSWHVKPAAWNLEYTDARSIITVVGGGHSIEAAASSQRQETPIRVGAQVRAGTGYSGVDEAPNHDSVLLTITVGLWLVELTTERRPSDRRHNELPLPAALTLDEVYSLILALTRCVETASLILGRLTGHATDPAMKAFVNLNFRASGELGAVVKLDHIERVGTRTQATFDQTYEVGSAAPEAADVAVQALGEWLLQSGYRGYPGELYGLWQAGLAA